VYSLKRTSVYTLKNTRKINKLSFCSIKKESTDKHSLRRSKTNKNKMHLTIESIYPVYFFNAVASRVSGIELIFRPAKNSKVRAKVKETREKFQRDG
jgi:hypothetical protein